MKPEYCLDGSGASQPGMALIWRYGGGRSVTVICACRVLETNILVYSYLYPGCTQAVQALDVLYNLTID